jgi:hypothetical protein
MTDKNKMMQECTMAADIMILAGIIRLFKNRVYMLKGRSKIDDIDVALSKIDNLSDECLKWFENRFDFPDEVDEGFYEMIDPNEEYLAKERKEYVEIFKKQYKKKIK